MRLGEEGSQELGLDGGLHTSDSSGELDLLLIRLGISPTKLVSVASGIRPRVAMRTVTQGPPTIESYLPFVSTPTPTRDFGTLSQRIWRHNVPLKSEFGEEFRKVTIISTRGTLRREGLRVLLVREEFVEGRVVGLIRRGCSSCHHRVEIILHSGPRGRRKVDPSFES